MPYNIELEFNRHKNSIIILHIRNKQDDNLFPVYLKTFRRIKKSKVGVNESGNNVWDNRETTVWISRRISVDKEHLLIVSFQNNDQARIEINQMFEALSGMPEIKQNIKKIRDEWSTQLRPLGIDLDKIYTVKLSQFAVLGAFYKANQNSDLRESILSLLPTITQFAHSDSKPYVLDEKQLPSAAFFKSHNITKDPTLLENTLSCLTYYRKKYLF